jgi:hypothetical protein
MISPNKPCIRFIVGNAGAGKSVLFQGLFAILYRHFIDLKIKLTLSPRPIPFIPQHLRSTYTIRTLALVDSFLRSDVAAPVSRETLEWMLTNGHCIWMFDGLDELYSGDPEFFDYLLDLLTRPDSHAQILVCARDSWNRRPSCSSVMPMPVSETANRTIWRSLSKRSATTVRRPFSVNLLPLLKMRLVVIIERYLCAIS